MEAVWRAASGDIFLSLVRQSAKRVQLGESGRARRSDKGGERTMERERERERENVHVRSVCVSSCGHATRRLRMQQATRERESTKNKEGESTQHTPREKRKERAMRERRARDLARENHSSCKIRLWAGGLFSLTLVLWFFHTAHGNGVLCRVLSYKSPEHGSACHGAETKRPPPTTRARATEKEKRK